MVCALRFFYGITLDCAEIPERIAYARTPRKLPDILSADEVVRILQAVSSLKARAALTTAYAAGLRASETVNLKIADINSDRMLIQIRHGKGCKDRTVMLSPLLLGILRTYWRLAHPATWLFPGREDKPIDVQVLQAACRSATKPLASSSWSVSIRCVTALRRTCSRTVSISGSSRCWWGTITSQPQPAIPMSRRRRSRRRKVRSTA